MELLADGTNYSLAYSQPFHDYWYLFVGVALVYPPAIYALVRYMAPRAPYRLKPLLVMWNGGLCALTAVMLWRIIPYCVALWTTHAWREVRMRAAALPRSHAAVHLPASSLWTSRRDLVDVRVDGLRQGEEGRGCPAQQADRLLQVLELFDTVLLALRKKPIITLHWYHHMTVLVFTWASHVYAQVRELRRSGVGKEGRPHSSAQTNVHIVFTAMNCFVHVLMYAYYALTAVNIFFPWPQVLTVLQVPPLLSLLSLS